MKGSFLFANDTGDYFGCFPCPKKQKQRAFLGLVLNHDPPCYNGSSLGRSGCLVRFTDVLPFEVKEYRRKKLRPNADLADVPRKFHPGDNDKSFSGKGVGSNWWLLWKFQGSKAGVLGQSSHRSEMVPVCVLFPASWLVKLRHVHAWYCSCWWCRNPASQLLGLWETLSHSTE